MKRKFSNQQKRHLYLSGEGKCEMCGEPLGKRWDAHHENRYVDGGVTEIQNGAALCQGCHVLSHRRIGMIKPRGWQARALAKFVEHNELSFLLEATPAAGKTIFSGLCAQHLVQQNKVDFSLVVVPTTALKGDKDAGFLGDWHKVGIELAKVLKDGRGRPSDFNGGVVTYQQLPNFINTAEVWASHGCRLFVVFDEIHHATEENVWGAAAERLARCTERNSGKILAMTGTPFRGDGRRISFVQYDEGDCAKPDHKYVYRQAVADNVCRPVQFITDDGVAQYVRNETEYEVRLSEAHDDEERSGAAATIFTSQSKWLRTVLDKADSQLDEYRAWDADAGGLVICRPGTDHNDDRHLEYVAKLVADVTGENPEVIRHDDPDANAKIERFRRGTARWICAVRKISEGVDIKRLRVEVIANCPTTELLFRQLVGRVLRVDDEQRPGDATVYLAKFPQLSEWAARLSEDAVAGLRERPPRPREMAERDSATSFSPINATHEDGGLISEFGERYAAEELNGYQRLIQDDPQFAGLSIQQGLRLLRKSGWKPDPMEAPTEPLHVQKSRLRDEIIRTAKTVAIRRNPAEPDFKGVQVSLWRRLGVKNIDDLMENHSIERMRQALEILHTWLVGNNEAA